MTRTKNMFKALYEKRLCYAFIAPFFILFFIFTVLPVISSIFLGFTDYNMLQTPKFVFFDNYVKMLFADDIFVKAALNTFTMAIIIGPVSYLGALLLAWVLNELGRGIRTFLVFLIYIPSLTGGAYMIWQLLFSGDQLGYINSILLDFGLISSPLQWLTDTKYMMAVVLIVSIWGSMGSQFLSFVAGLQGLDLSLFEAGVIDGVQNRWQELWYITIPQLKPQLVFGAVISVSSAFSVGAVGATMCGMPSTDYAVHTIINHMSDYSGLRMELGYSCAMAVVLFVVMLASKNLIGRLLKNVGN